MKIGVSTLEASVRRVAYAAGSASRRKLEHGRTALADKAEAALMITYRSYEKCLEIFATSGGLFATDKVHVEIEDKDDEDFVVYIYPFHLLDYLSSSSGTVSFYKYRQGVRLIFDSKQKVYLSSQYQLADFFASYQDQNYTFDGAILEVNALALKEALSFTDYISDGKNIMDQVVLIETVNDSLSFGSTDGWRLATFRNVKNVKEKVKASIFKTSASRLNHMIESEDVDIRVFFDKRKIYIMDCDFVAGSLVTQESRDIWGVIDTFPARDYLVFSPDADLFRKALNIVSSFADEGTGAATLEMSGNDGNGGRIWTEAQQVGSTFWNLGADVPEDKELKVAFNPKSLLEFMTHVRPKHIELRFSSDPHKPFAVGGDNEDSELIVMPMRVGGS